LENTFSFSRYLTHIVVAVIALVASVPVISFIVVVEAPVPVMGLVVVVSIVATAAAVIGVFVVAALAPFYIFIFNIVVVAVNKHKWAMILETKLFYNFLNSFCLDKEIE